MTSTAALLLKDLYQHITPQYAADWIVIGTLLDLPSGELKATEAGYLTEKLMSKFSKCIVFSVTKCLRSGLKWTPLPPGEVVYCN